MDGSRKLNNVEVDAMFDKSHLNVNKKMSIFIGVWPYRSEMDKIFRRIIISTVLTMSTLPQLLGIYRQCGRNMTICAENIAGLAYCVGCIVKYIVPVASKKKFELVFKKIAESWLLITDPDEQLVLDDFGKIGKLKTAGYVGYCIVCGFFFSQMAVIPSVLDIIIPLNESRDRLLVTNAEYPFDPFEYYYELYIFYCIATVITTTVLTSCDSTYAVIVQQSLAIFTIVKFIDLIESMYKMACLTCILGTIVFLSFGSIIVVNTSDKILEFLRMVLFEIGVMIHIFYISLPGQLVIEYSEDIFLSAYTVEWYALPERAKTLLKIVMLRSVKPCILTAGGFYVMNMQNYGSIVKTTLSYVTVAMSYQS